LENLKRTIDEVVETVRQARGFGKCCTLLIGAGCSVTAGIPTAQGFVEAVREGFPRAYERAVEKTYPDCMAELSPAERHDLIAKYVDGATINWGPSPSPAHPGRICGPVLTTNFDPL